MSFLYILVSTMAKLLYQAILISSVIGCIATACVCQKQRVTVNYTISNGNVFPLVVRKCERVLNEEDLFETGNIIDLPAGEPPCCCKSQWRYKVSCRVDCLMFGSLFGSETLKQCYIKYKLSQKIWSTQVP